MPYNNYMYILGIETSCDETAASIIKADPKSGRMAVLANIVSSQIAIHRQYGGVVPEVAAREHVLNILPVINEALVQSKIEPDRLDLLAVTKGPGLVTSLITGLETVRTLAFAWSKPVMEINHIEGHIYANFIRPKTPIRFPAVVLTVSGGHTTLVEMADNRKIRIIGETRDDAAGEAYDKAAKMLGLGYPGGPIIARLAAKHKKASSKVDNQNRFHFPRPMLNAAGFDFSFSGLKTALLYQLEKDPLWRQRIPEYCFEFQQAIIDTLVAKTIKAAQKFRAKTVMLSGGVSANSELRRQLAKAVKESLPKANLLMPELDYTTDNAAMVAAAAAFKIKSRKPVSFERLAVDPGLQLR